MNYSYSRCNYLEPAGGIFVVFQSRSFRSRCSWNWGVIVVKRNVIVFFGLSVVFFQSCSRTDTYPLASIKSRLTIDSMQVTCADLHIQNNCSDTNIFVDGGSSFGGDLEITSITTKQLIDSLFISIHVKKKRNLFVGDAVVIPMAYLHIFAPIDTASHSADSAIALKGILDYKIYDPDYAEFYNSFFRDSLSGYAMPSKPAQYSMANPDSLNVVFVLNSNRGRRFQFSTAIQFSSEIVSYTTGPSM